VEREGELIVSNQEISFYVTGLPQPIVRIPVDQVTGIDFSPGDLPKRKIIIERMRRRRFVRVFVGDCPEPYIFAMSNRDADSFYDVLSTLISARVEIREIPEEVSKLLRSYEEKLNELKNEIERIKNQTSEEIIRNVNRVFGEFSELKGGLSRLQEECLNKLQSATSENRMQIEGMTLTVIRRLDELSNKLAELESMFSQVFFRRVPEAEIARIGLVRPPNVADLVQYLNERFPEKYLGALILFGTEAYRGGEISDDIWQLGSLGIISRLFSFLNGSEKYFKVAIIDNQQDLRALFENMPEGRSFHRDNRNVEVKIFDVSNTGFGRYLSTIFSSELAGNIKYAIDVIGNNVLNYIREHLLMNAFVTIHSIGATSKLGDLFGIERLKTLISAQDGKGLSISVLKPFLERDTSGICFDYLINLWFLMRDEALSAYRKALVMNQNLRLALKTANRLALCHILTYGISPYTIDGVYASSRQIDLISFLRRIKRFLMGNRNIKGERRKIKVNGALISFAWSSDITYPRRVDVSLIKERIQHTVRETLSSIKGMLKEIVSSRGLIALVWVKTRYLPKEVDDLVRIIRMEIENFAELGIVYVINWNDNTEDFVVVEIMYDPDEWYMNLLRKQPLSILEELGLEELRETIEKAKMSFLGAQIEGRGIDRLLNEFTQLLNEVHGRAR